MRNEVDVALSFCITELLKEVGLDHTSFFAFLENTKGDFLAKLYNFRNTSRIKALRKCIKGESAASLDEIYDFCESFIMCGSKRNKEFSYWENLSLHIMIEVVKIYFFSKDIEQTDKYFTYWVILGIFHELEDTVLMILALVNWDKTKWDEVVDLGIDFESKFLARSEKEEEHFSL